jgi:hypothetical protein
MRATSTTVVTTWAMIVHGIRVNPSIVHTPGPEGVTQRARLGADEVVGDRTKDDVQPQGDDGDGEQFLPEHRPNEDPLQDHADEGGQGEGRQHRQCPAQPLGSAGDPPPRDIEDRRERSHEEGAETGQSSVGEVQDLGGLEDDHEAHGEQGVYGSEREEIDQQPAGGRRPHLSEDHRLDHDEYISLISSLNMLSMALRFTFWVAVSSPSS